MLRAKIIYRMEKAVKQRAGGGRSHRKEILQTISAQCSGLQLETLEIHPIAVACSIPGYLDMDEMQEYGDCWMWTSCKNMETVASSVVLGITVGEHTVQFQ